VGEWVWVSVCNEEEREGKGREGWLEDELPMVVLEVEEDSAGW
jgi:hypothetical protein